MANRNAISNAVGYAKFRSRSHDAVIRVYDEAGNLIQTHEHKGPAVEYFSKNGFHHPWRSTAWEIHPVMKIEVIRN